MADVYQGNKVLQVSRGNACRFCCRALRVLHCVFAPLLSTAVTAGPALQAQGPPGHQGYIAVSTAQHSPQSTHEWGWMQVLRAAVRGSTFGTVHPGCSIKEESSSLLFSLSALNLCWAMEFFQLSDDNE